MEDSPKRFERYVAIGDSSTEGLNDPDGNGGYIGWSRRLAARLADVQGGLLYANLGVRGLKTREILDQQLDSAVAMKPDLVTVFSGTNDAIGQRFNPRSIERDMERMQHVFVEGGATVLTFTLPDLTPIMPLARLIAPNIQAMNDALRRATARSGATLLDFAAYPVATDPRLWHADRIHANAAGHSRIADALAHALELPGTNAAWKDSLPPLTPRSFGKKLTAEAIWTGRYFLPWMGLGIRARFRKRRQRKRPTLDPVLPAAAASREGFGRDTK